MSKLFCSNILQSKTFGDALATPAPTALAGSGSVASPKYFWLQASNCI